MSSESTTPASVHDFEVTTIDGEEKPLGEFTRGKVALIVNVASKCGFTPQYEGLQALFEEYQSRGFVVCGFPSNEFGGQEPGSNSDIKDFACGRFHVTFPMFGKVSVNGADEHPLYNFLKHAKPGIFGTKGIVRRANSGCGFGEPCLTRPPRSRAAGLARISRLRPTRRVVALDRGAEVELHGALSATCPPRLPSRTSSLALR